ncbi:MAG: YabP/YqfC family sporulation protein [Clostridia bacterium]|nr:YabP/YqfC family sporulation protein [Clostridia bacterium]
MKIGKNGGLLRRFQEAVKALEIPEELTGEPTVTLEGSRSARIEGHRGIIRYEDDEIEVAAKGCVIRLCGKRLRLAVMDRDDIRIVGSLSSVEYARGDRK